MSADDSHSVFTDSTADDNIVDTDAYSQVSMPRLAEYDESTYIIDNHINDQETMTTLMRSVNDARVDLFHITEKINETERKLVQAKVKYERCHRRYMISSRASNATDRKLEADIKSERLEDDYIMFTQLKKELENKARVMRDELQTLQMISNNLRQQLRTNASL